MDLTRVTPIVIVFNHSPNTVYNDELRSIGVQVVEVPYKVNSILKRAIFLNKFFRQHKPNIVHSWSVHDNPYAGLVGLLSGVPFRFGSMRASLNHCNYLKLSPLFRFLSIYSVQKLFVNALSTQAELLQNKYPKNKIIFLDNCVELPGLVNHDLKDFPVKGFPVSSIMIGTVGNLRRNKNFHIFIQSLAVLIPKFPDLKGVIIGQPFHDEQDYPALLANMIKDLGISGKVVLSGFIDDVPELMKTFSVFCLLSSSEGTPNVVLEAMAAARPVIATSVGGIPEIIKNGVNGLLVEPENVGSFTEALEMLLSDPQLAFSLGQAGRQQVEEKFSPIVRSDQLVEIYQGLLRGHNGY